MSSNACRFFEAQVFILNNNFILNEQNSHKIINVLRLAIDSIIKIFNNTNTEFIAKIINIKQKKIVEIIILAATPKNVESPLKIHLVQAIAKHDNMDIIIQKTTELGVYHITPIITDRTIVKINKQQLTKKLEHWQLIAINACCQCGRTIVPKINNIILFKSFLESNFNTYKFILSPQKNINKNNLNLDINKEIYIIIGPEGGFSNQELMLAEQNQCVNINIGPRILRTETAAIAAVSVLQANYGDLIL